MAADARADTGFGQHYMHVRVAAAPARQNALPYASPEAEASA